MGLFSWIKDKCSRVVDAIGEGVENLGRITHINFIENLGSSIFCRSNMFAKRTDIDKITHDELYNINAACEEYRRSADMQVKEKAEKCIKEIENKVIGFKNQFSDIIGDNDYSLSDTFKTEVKESVSAYVAKKVSIDNKEFNKILNMKDSIRKEKSDEFLKRTLSEAGEELNTKCNNKYKAIIKRMLEDLDDYFTRQHDFMQDIADKEERIEESENAIETKKALIREGIIEASTFESIRTLTYSN